MKNLTNKFFTFANGLYTMCAAKSNMKDGRKSPQISPSVIFLSLILMVLFKKRSLLKLDQFMRTDAAKRFFGRGSRRLVAVSDTTVARSLSTYFLTPLRSYIKKDRHEDFWVLCTDESLSGLQLRELGHIRWRIENNGFKQLDEQTNCDHVYTHDAHTLCEVDSGLSFGANANVVLRGVSCRRLM